MAVCQTDVFFLVCILQNNAGIEGNTGTERVFTVLFAAPGAKVFLEIGRVSFHNIVIAVYGVHAAFLIVLGDDGKTLWMYVLDFSEGAVFPQLVTVSEFQISEVSLKIVAQGRKVQKFIFHEIISCVSASPMAVAEKDIPGLVIERQPQRVFKGLRNSLVGIHEYLLDAEDFLCLRYFLGFSMRRKAKGRK